MSDRHAGKTNPLPPHTGHATRRPREHAPTWKIQMAPRRHVRHGIRNENTRVMSSSAASAGSKRAPRPPSAGGGDGQGTRAGPAGGGAGSEGPPLRLRPWSAMPTQEVYCLQ